MAIIHNLCCPFTCANSQRGKKTSVGLDAMPECQLEVYLGLCSTYAYIAATPKISCLHTHIKTST